jgi:hypothetical protein
VIGGSKKGIQVLPEYGPCMSIRVHHTQCAFDIATLAPCLIPV